MTIESLAAGIRRERRARRRLVCLSDALAVTAQDVVNSPYVVTGETGSVHIYPTPALSEQIKAQQAPALGPGVLGYDGGPIMTGVNLYAIFWVPAKLQNGHSTSLTAKYESVAPAAIPSLRQLHY